MYEYQSPDIAGLAAQLKRGPRRLAIRQLHAIDFLLSVIERGKSYPFDFLLHAITGYHTTPQDEAYAADSRLLSESDLRDDLVTLAEDLSGVADLEIGCCDEAVFTVAEVSARFEVSTKTVFRWRRRGLVGWRLRFADRRVRLAFPEHCIRRFVAANADLVNRGASFSQLTATERAWIVERARKLVDAGERTVNSVAKVVAGEIDRAVETIRLILKSYDEAHPRSGVFNRSSLKVDIDDERLKIWEAYVDGASIETLGKRFGRSAKSVYATLTEMRARELKTRQIEFVPSDEFPLADADELILNDPAAAAPYNGPTPTKRIPAGLPPYLQQLFRLRLLTREGEAALFRKYNYLKFKADRLRQGVDAESATPAELDEVEDLLERADRLKSEITQANLRLVISIAKRHATPARDFFEIVSDGNISLMRAVEKFDYSRGFKFSTYASWAIIKNFARTVPEHRHQYDRYQTGREEMLECVSAPTREEHESDYLPMVRFTLDRMFEVLDDRERGILRQRFGIDEHREPKTLEQIGKHFGVSKERIRQLEARAMDKLREEFAGDVQGLLAQ